MAALALDALKAGLSQVSKTADESGENFAFVKVDVSEQGLTSLGEALPGFPHLRYVKASGNALTDLAPLAQLPNLLAVDAARNQIAEVAPLPLEFLQALDLSENSIASAAVPGPPPMLKMLNLSKNALASLEGLDTMPALERLDANGNAGLKSTSGIGAVATLKILNLAECGLETPVPEEVPAEGEGEGEDAAPAEPAPLGPNALAGLEGLVALEELDVSANQVSVLADLVADAAEGGEPGLGALRKIVAANNKVAALEDVGTLAALPALRDLDLRDNEVGGADNYRQEVLILLPKLESLDGEKVTPEERQEAKQVNKERLREKAEAEAAAAAAAAAAEAEEDE